MLKSLQMAFSAIIYTVESAYGLSKPNLYNTIIESCKRVIKLYGENLLGLVKCIACYSQSESEPFKVSQSDLH